MAQLLTFNRTILELKLDFILYCCIKSGSFNRTILELKPVNLNSPYSNVLTFNRTILELKLGKIKGIMTLR